MTRPTSVRCDFCDVLIFPAELAIKMHDYQVSTSNPKHPTRAVRVCRKCYDEYALERDESDQLLEEDTW